MKLLFPGSFDPFTTGHADLVERALKVADEVVIAIGINENKQALFTVDERSQAIAAYYSGNKRIRVITYNGLTVDVLHMAGCDAILRGVRSVTDFETEREMCDVNRAIGGAETLLLVADQSLQHVSSSLVRELLLFGRSVDGLIIDTFKPFLKA